MSIFVVLIGCKHKFVLKQVKNPSRCFKLIIKIMIIKIYYFKILF